MPKLTISSAKKFLQEIKPFIPKSNREFIMLHSHQVARIAKLLGEQAGLDSVSMEIAGYVHDIGYSRESQSARKGCNALRPYNTSFRITTIP